MNNKVSRKEIRLDIAKGEFLVGWYETRADHMWEMIELYHHREIKPEGANKAAVYYTNLQFLLPSFNAGLILKDERLRIDREILHLQIVERSI
jgi:hypothetical protein